MCILLVNRNNANPRIHDADHFLALHHAVLKNDVATVEAILKHKEALTVR